jgi:hypothetical protein
MADEILAHPADSQASFVGFENGRPVLQGMSRGRLRDFDRPDRETRMAEELRAVEIKRLMKLRSRRRKPDVYRAQRKRYEFEHKDDRARARRRRYWADAKLARAKLRAHRQKHATQNGLPRKTCSACGQVGHNRRSHA